MARKNALRLRSRDTVHSGAVRTAYRSYVETGKLYCFEQITWVISKAMAAGNLRCRLYIDGHGYSHQLTEIANPVADRIYEYNEVVWLHPRERLALDLDQPPDNTDVEINITGYWQGITEE